MKFKSKKDSKKYEVLLVLQRKSSNFLTVCYFYFLIWEYTLTYVYEYMISSHQYHFFPFLSSEYSHSSSSSHVLSLWLFLKYIHLRPYTYTKFTQTQNHDRYTAVIRVNKNFIDRAYQHITFWIVRKKKSGVFCVCVWYVMCCCGRWAPGRTVTLFHQYFVLKVNRNDTYATIFWSCVAIKGGFLEINWKV